jgi:hypothetical protein
VQSAKGVAEFLQEGRQQRPALGEFLARQEFRKQFPDHGVVGQPQEEGVVGFVPQQFLEDGQTKDFAVIHVRCGAGAP